LLFLEVVDQTVRQWLMGQVRRASEVEFTSDRYSHHVDHLGYLSQKFVTAAHAL
jgi:hypothetical protein